MLSLVFTAAKLLVFTDVLSLVFTFVQILVFVDVEILVFSDVEVLVFTDDNDASGRCDNTVLPDNCFCFLRLAKKMYTKAKKMS